LNTSSPVRAERGLAAGVPDRAVGGENEGCRIVIDEPQAAVVRRIFESYIAVASARSRIQRTQ
jgi:hypothetical protein